MTHRYYINKPVFAVLFSFFIVASACAQVDNTEARKERIKANLMVLFPQLETHTVDMGDFEEIGTPGVEMGRFVVDGQQQQPFLITDGDKKMYLLAGGPFDVSKTEEDLAVEIAALEEAKKAKAKEINADLVPATADLPYRGSADAPVTIIELSDFQCPYCAKATDTMHKLVAKHAENVKLIYVQFPLESIHPWARPASIASLCAANQSDEAFWTLHDKYFEDQRALNENNVIEKSRAYLAGSGINMDQWSTCSTDASSEPYQTASALVDSSLELGVKYGISSTPAFFVNGQLISGAQPLETFEQAVQDALED